MLLYSFRAECQADLDKLTLALRTRGIMCSMRATQDPQFPDCAVELETDATVQAIRDVMRSVEDGHVMVETLRPCQLADNSLERDYGV